MSDIHDMIANAERRPGNAVSIDPPDGGEDALCQCGDAWEDHTMFGFEGKRYALCEDGVAGIRAVLGDHDNIFTEADDDDGPDPDRAQDEAIDRQFDPPERN